MYKFLLRTCLLAGLAACSITVLGLAPAQADEGRAWGGAARWIGHAPSDRVGHAGESFFELAEIAAQFPKLLTTEKLSRFASYADADRVAEVGHYLVAHRCQPGNCGAGMITVILDEGSENMWVVLTENNGTEFSRCWTGTQHYSALPGVLQAAFTSD